MILLIVFLAGVEETSKSMIGCQVIASNIIFYFNCFPRVVLDGWWKESIVIDRLFCKMFKDLVMIMKFTDSSFVSVAIGVSFYNTRK